MIDATHDELRNHWLFRGTESQGPLAAGVLLTLRAGPEAATILRQHVWQRAFQAEVPCAWLDVGAAGSQSRKIEQLRGVPKKAWPVMGHAYDWMSAWSWAEAWHRRLKHSWVVIEAEGEEQMGRADALMPVAEPRGLSVARERRLRHILRAHCGRVVALSPV